MNKVLIVGELVKQFTLGTNNQFTEQGFIVATIREPKDPKKPKELHFIYCKAFGKVLPEVLTQINEGDILCVSGQLATVTKHTSNGREYRVELWAESIRAMPEKVHKQNLINPDRQLNEAIRSYGLWDEKGEKSIYILPEVVQQTDDHIRSLQNVMKTLNVESKSTETEQKKEKEPVKS
ncbi:single-stranded DNA-binding protein [Aliicoccus persicus]|uniref:Single-strand DNA-binding protein n=1 Tax=Aliicoccus persicus TaxID=930138 RepID=A0A662Z454_9STAP|nr:single-stranded DNA-binding protein [Aliicoccus persicus]SEW08699.1 single-strand DNA-binding protein [Aliicoccus persicus]